MGELEMTDYLGDMIEAYDKELMLWFHEKLNPGTRTSMYTVSRGDKLLLQGDLIETEDACERFSKRAAMRAAIRVLTSCPLEEMGIDEEDKIEMTDVTEVPYEEQKKEVQLPGGFQAIIADLGWAEDTTARLERMEEKIDRILAHLEKGAS